MNEKTLKPKPAKIIGLFSIVAIFLLLILYLTFGSRFMYFNLDEDELWDSIIADIIIVAVWIAIVVIFLIVLLKYNYYTVTKTEIIHHRFNKDLHYDFKKIIYIDEVYTEKHGTLCFYTDKGNCRFLILDKNKELYEIVKANATNALTREQFHAKFPKIKL